MNPKSYPQLQEKFGGKFIARTDGRVIASAKTSKALWDKVKKRIGDPRMVIEHIEPKGAICIYGEIQYLTSNAPPAPPAPAALCILRKETLAQLRAGSVGCGR